MVKLLIGGSGTGKTRRLVDLANETAKQSHGHLIFVDDDTRHMYDVESSIRFINIKEFPIDSFDSCFGFLCGIISSDYDIDCIFIDGMYKVLNTDLDNLGLVLPKLERLGEQFGVKFYITVSASELSDEFTSYIF